MKDSEKTYGWLAGTQNYRIFPCGGEQLCLRFSKVFRLSLVTIQMSMTVLLFFQKNGAEYV